jgi:hypothetical protein
MNEFSASKVDRRQSPRTKLVQIAYIGMGPENGGLVLDVSDGGLSFHAVAPVQRSETVRFLLSLRGHSRVEGAGEVVWTNDARTVCGLKFTSLSSGAREHLNNWTDQSRIPSPAAAPAAAADAADSAVAPPGEAETPLIEEPETEQALPEEEELAVSLASPPETETQPLFAIPPADHVLLSNPGARQQQGGGLFLWVLFVLLGAAIVVAAFLYGVHVGQSQVIAVVQPQTPPASATQTEPPGPAASSAPATTPPPMAANDAPPASNPTPSAPASATPSLSVESSVTKVAPSSPSGAAEASSKTADGSTNPAPAAGVQGQRTEQPEDAAKSQLAAAMADLDGSNGQRNSAKAVKELWSAVGSGNSDAEIILAGLYAAGDGVTKSCEQGRVLLIAAARSGNPKAKPKLDELNARGCR